MSALRVALNLLLWPPAAIVAALCAFASIAAQWGRVSLQWDVLAHFAPLWLLGSAIGATTALVFRGWRRWSLALLGLAGLVAGASLVAPEYLRDTGPQAPADAPGQIKLVQFNVWHKNDNPAQALDWLEREDPDIIVIEENTRRFARAAAARDRWSVACPRCEVMILSKRPALASAAAKHRRRPAAPLTWATFEDDLGGFEVIGVHNAWPTDADQPIQERRLAATIADRSRERLIVVGDFNSAPWSFQRRQWDRINGLTRRDRALPTWPAQTYKRLPWLGLPFLAIDHVYAGPGWATVSINRGPRLSSDHYPVVVTLAPVTPEPGARR